MKIKSSIRDGSWFRPKEWVFAIDKHDCKCMTIYLGWFIFEFIKNRCNECIAGDNEEAEQILGK